MAVLAVPGLLAVAQTPTTKPHSQAGKHVDPEINRQFKKAKVKDFVKRFESEDREVFARREEIVRSIGLRPGMSVADIGAGTGLFTRLFAEQVGPRGKVYAVDISKDFLKHIADAARSRGEPQVVTIQGTQDSTRLPEDSIDLAFFCDVYHHIEQHESLLATVHKALRKGGELILIEFDRVEGKSSDFVLKHVRASQKQFIAEVEAAGFVREAIPGAPKLKENFIARFRKLGRPAPAPAAPPAGR
jgi:ubiquinone/menaquinone biosynthesis C-methylase UbiE